MKTIIKCDAIYTEYQVIDGYLVIENGKIQDILPASTTINYDVDASNHLIIPGIFDTHNHGTMGWNMFYEGQQPFDEIKGYLKALASQGVTAVFPTVSPAMIRDVAQMAKAEIGGAKILGIHSEGPYLNRVGEKGRAEEHPPIDRALVEKMIDDGQGLLRLFSLAPEIEAIDSIIDLLNQSSIKIGMAHTNCTYQEARLAFDQGIRIATHLGNVMTGLHHRDIGAFGAALLDERIDCELICDGMHISLPMIELIFRCKSIHRIMMISDCTPFSGLRAGVYDSPFETGQVTVTNEGFVKDEQGRLRGSSKPVLYGIKQLVQKLKIPLEKVVLMSSLNPSRVYGYDLMKGSIKIGKDADLLILDQDLNLLQTYVEGRLVYDVFKHEDLINPKFETKNRLDSF